MINTLINIDVPELQSAIDFYCAALELKPGRMLDNDVAELIGASSRIYLLQKEAGSPSGKSAGGTRRYSRHWTPVHMDFVVDNVEIATQRALAAGAIRESERIEWRGSKCITFRDPFGHGFCLIEFDGETYSDE